MPNPGADRERVRPRGKCPGAATVVSGQGPQIRSRVESARVEGRDAIHPASHERHALVAAGSSCDGLQLDVRPRTQDVPPQDLESRRRGRVDEHLSARRTRQLLHAVIAGRIRIAPVVGSLTGNVFTEVGEPLGKVAGRRDHDIGGRFTLPAVLVRHGEAHLIRRGRGIRPAGSDRRRLRRRRAARLPAIAPVDLPRPRPVRHAGIGEVTGQRNLLANGRARRSDRDCHRGGYVRNGRGGRRLAGGTMDVGYGKRDRELAVVDVGVRGRSAGPQVPVAEAPGIREIVTIRIG
jgi:hypothetical protein